LDQFTRLTERAQSSNPREPQHVAPCGPSPAAVAEVEEFLLDEMYSDLHLIQSYTISAMEAARRGDREELRLRLRVQLRDCFRHAVELHKLLTPEQPKQGGV
jgi:hypothetical protein